MKILFWWHLGASEDSWAGEWLGSYGEINLVMVWVVWVGWRKSEWGLRSIQEVAVVIQGEMMTLWWETLSIHTLCKEHLTVHCEGHMEVSWCPLSLPDQGASRSKIQSVFFLPSHSIWLCLPWGGHSSNSHDHSLKASASLPIDPSSLWTIPTPLLSHVV